MVNFFPLIVAYGCLAIAFITLKAQKLDQSNQLRQHVINELFDKTTFLFKLSDDNSSLALRLKWYHGDDGKVKEMTKQKNYISMIHVMRELGYMDLEVGDDSLG